MATQTSTGSPTAAATPTAPLAATPTASPTPSPTETAPAPPTATTAPPTPTPATPGAPAGGGGGDEGGGDEGGSGASAAAAPSPTRSPTPAPTPAPTPHRTYTAAAAGGALEIRGSDGSVVRAALALTDPEGGPPRFRGWLRCSAGPIFGVTADGRLEWISPEDGAALAAIDWARVLTVPDDALTSAPLAPPRPGWLLWDYRGTRDIYVVGEDGQLHHIPDLRTFAARFEWRNVLPVSPEQMSQLPVGAAIPPVA
jgi:hypothetical protein